MESAVIVENLTRKFGHFVAVDHISFSIPRGQVFGFLGANGAGKSTTIRMLCGLLKPTSGQAIVAGYDIYHQSEEIKKVIGYMSQKFSLYRDLKVKENLEFFARVYGLDNKKFKSRVAELEEKIGLSGKEELITGKLPVGWRQRLALACAILHQPEIIFLDEPTGGVDPLARRQFWDLIYDLSSEGKTIFVTTHYLDEAEYCQEIKIMHAGRIIAEGSPAQIKKRYFPEKLFELVTAEPLRIYNWLKEQPEIEQISLFGKKLHLLISSDQVKQIQERGNGLGIGRFDLRPIVPTLEDVFIRRLEEAGGEKGK
ncbi:MAG: ATP-binding cassette domain-containing protein [Candidatus Saccharicenans sp.]